MIRLRAFLVLGVAAVLAAGCGASRSGDITQVATIDALLAGSYDGTMTLGALKRHGDFGIGTFHALDGEMLLLDGTVWQIRSDGTIHAPADGVTTPFASACFFDRRAAGVHSEVTAAPFGFPAFQEFLDARFSNRNLFYAIHVRGEFTLMRTRSVPAQAKPYPTLAEVAKTQPVFERSAVTGTLVGFRCPPFVKGVNVPGYHLHFLSDARDFGGHVLEFTLAPGATVAVLPIHDLRVILPRDGAFGRIDLTHDRSAELDRVER